MNAVDTRRLVIVATLALCVALVMSAIPVSAEEENGPIGPQPTLADDSFEMEFEAIEDEYEEGGTILYDVTIRAEVPTDNFPYIYPVDFVIEENDRQLERDVLYLSPTQSPAFVPSPDAEPGEDYLIRENFQVRLAFTQDSDRNRQLTFEADSRYTDDEYAETRIDEVDGESPAGRDMQTSTISTTRDVDEPSDVTYVSRYRIQPAENIPGHLEDYTIPLGDELTRGEMDDFGQAREPDGGAAVFSADSNGFRMLTLTEDIMDAEPQTIAIGYELISGNEVEVSPVDAAGREINTESYILPENPEDSPNCRSVSNQDLCLFTLSQDEVDTINQLGEMYLEYSGDYEVNGQLYCQSIISGYLPRDGVTCGQSEVGDPSLAYLTEFEGQDEVSQEWQRPNVTVDYRSADIDEADVDMRFTAGAHVGEDDTPPTVDVKLYHESALTFGDFEHEPLAEEESVVLDEPFTLHTLLEDVPRETLPSQYIAVMCETGTECTYTDNMAIQWLDVEAESGSDAEPVIVADEPLRIDLNIADTEELVTSTSTLETVDDSVNQDTSREGWTLVDEEDGFTGTVEETVIVRDVFADEYTSPDIVFEDDAIEKRTNIDFGGDWSSEYDFTRVENSSEVRYSDTEPAGEGWERTTSVERLAEVDEKTEFFDIISEGEFTSVTEGEAGWYVDRDDFETRDAGVIETMRQHEDPDDCYNCLRAETREEALDRFENSTEQLVETQGDDIWDEASEEPYTQATLRELWRDLEYRDSEPGDGYYRVYENEDDSDLYRTSEHDRRPVYEWIHDTGAAQVEFQAPVREEVYRWERTSYDLVYEFEGEIETEQTIYEWEKEHTETIEEYEPERVWFDLSESYVEPRDSSVDLSHYDISFDGTSTPHTVEWIDDIQGIPPEERQCDGDIEERQVDGGPSGVGIFELCDPYDEDKPKHVLRVGKDYHQPGAYLPEINLYTEHNEEQNSTVEVNVNEGPTKPDLEVEPVNERVDYNIDPVVFDATLSSEHQDLGYEYELSVSPADTINTVQSCPTSYDEVESLSVQSETTTSDTFRESVSCVLNYITHPEEKPDNFTLAYESQITEEEQEAGEETELYPQEIPSGAIQECYDRIEEGNGEYDCHVPENVNSYSDEDSTIEYASSEGSFNDIDAENVGHCPAHYELETEETTWNGEEHYRQYCESTGDASFDLKTREVGVQYENIRAGVIEQCEDIPVSSETGTHGGYYTTTDDDTMVCSQWDDEDPGPSDFTLAEEVYDDGQTYWDYNTLPTGAVRGITLSDDSSSECDSGIEDDNTLTCDIDDETIRYGEIVEGSWSSLETGSSDIEDDSQMSKSVWQSDFLIEDEEDVTISVNPRQNSQIVPTGDDSTREFEFVLRAVDNPDIDIVEIQTVDVRLCEANSASILPRETPGGYECDGFDTMFTGHDDYLSERQGISEAMEVQEMVEDDADTDEVEFDIETTLNDACPYSQRYPRNQDDIEPETVTITETTTESEIQEEVEGYLQPYYAVNDDSICGSEDVDEDDEGDEQEDDGIEATSSITSTSDKDPQMITRDSVTYHFDRSSFVDADYQRGVRAISQYDLRDIDANPSQNRWRGGSGSLGGAVRLGTPVLKGDEGVNENLLAMYTFDHSPNHDEDFSFEPSSDFKEVNNYKVSDVYDPNIESAIGNDAPTAYSQLHHGRIWYGSPCGIDDGEQYRSGYYSYMEDGASTDCPRSRPGYYDLVDQQSLYWADSLDEERYEEFFQDFPISSQTGTYEHPIEEQSSMLHAPATEATALHLEQTDDDPEPWIAQLEERYSPSGVFGGSAVFLDDTAWIMLSPTCIHEESLGREGVGDVTEHDNCEYEGHYNELYEHDTKPSNTLSEELDGDWTVSFWVRTAKSLPNVESDDPEVQHPERGFRQTFGVSIPEDESPIDLTTTSTSKYPYQAHSSVELHHMVIPLGTIDDEGTYDYTSFDDPCYPLDLDDYGHDDPEWVVSQGLGFPVHCDMVPDDANTYGSYMLESTSHGQVESNEWNHVALRYTENSDQVSMYMNGDYTGQSAEYIYGDDDDIEFNLGEVHDNSVISLGAKYIEPAYTASSEQDYVYTPTLESSSGPIYIDEMRIYDEAISTTDASGRGSGQLGDISHGGVESPYTGYIRTNPLSEDATESNIQSAEPNSQLNVEVTASGHGEYELDIVPCDDDGECYPGASATIEDSGTPLSTTESTTGWDSETLIDDGVESVDSIQFRLNLLSNHIEQTPRISDIDIDIQNLGYSSCQALQTDYYGLSGDSFFTDITRGVTTEVGCDMDTDDGGWTQFYWAQEDAEYEFDTDTDDSAVVDDKPIAECDPQDDATCFTTADFEEYEGISGDFDDPTEIDPQILIKAVDADGQTERWAAFELDELMNYRENSDLGADCDSEDDCENDMALTLEDILDDGADDGFWNTDQCLYPFAHSSDYPAGECMNRATTITNSVGDATLMLSRAVEHDTLLIPETEFHHVRVQRDNDNQEIDDVRCLGMDDVERCEMYYKIGNSGDYTEVED